MYQNHKENRPDTYQVHQPILKKYGRLPKIHKKAESSEHRRFIVKREHQYLGFQGRGASDHHGFPCTAGIGIPFSQRANGHPVPQSARQVQINHNRFLSYTKDADGNLVIDPEQAEIVRCVYREYLKGQASYRSSEAWKQMASATERDTSNGMRATFSRSLPTRSASAMHFCRRPTRSAFWTRSEALTTARCRSITWKAAMRQSSTRMRS